MIFEVGQHFLIPSGTKFWCISIQESITLDKDLVCILNSWGCDKDVLFGYGTVDLMGGYASKNYFELNIGIKKVKPVKVESYFDGYLMSKRLIYV